MVIYLDTSALIKLYVEEEGREIVFEAVDEAEAVVTSTVAYAEARSGLARRFRGGDFTDEEYRRMIDRLNDNWKTYDRLTVSNPVSQLAGDMAEQHALRGFDLRVRERVSFVLLPKSYFRRAEYPPNG